MPSTDEQAFLDAVLASPDDDTPRLVFADWLDERAEGDDTARAALIRAQCRMEHLSPHSKERKELARQVKSLLAEHEDTWVKPVRDLGFVRKWEFRRGFLHAVTLSATQFAHNAEKLFAAAPTIRAARFPDASNEVSRLAGCEYLGRLA
ncbi:MAG: TIGR02996 domain-containing protein, partial [Gemmataceae bacterium]|nr:TIGR02996 domain-containing protein [Gemmataceae bacterium]